MNRITTNSSPAGTNLYRKALATIALCSLGAAASAAIIITDATPITQNFDSIGNTATATMPTDWKIGSSATVRTPIAYSAAATATAQTGANNIATNATTGIYNFGSGTDNLGTDRAVGGLGGGSTGSVMVAAQFKNNEAGGQSLRGFTVSYDVEKYRDGTNAAGFTMQLYCSTDGTNWVSGGNIFATSWPADADLNGAATVPIDTKSVANKTIYLPQLALSSGFAYLAWVYSTTSQTAITNGQGLGLDNVSITPIFGSASAATVWNNTSGGTITIPGDYSNLTDCATAFNALAVNGGTGYAINGNWFVELAAGAHTCQSTLALANTVHPTNGSVTIRPVSGAVVTLSRGMQAATNSDNGLNAAIVIGNQDVTNVNVDTGTRKTDNFTIDGSNGVGSSLSISNSPGQLTLQHHGISVWGSSSNGAIKNCTVTDWGALASSNFHAINFAARRNAVFNSNDIPNNWKVTTCTVIAENGTQAGAIGCQAASGALVGAISGLEIKGCTISGRQKGILLNCNADAVISGNTIRVNQSTGNLATGIRHQTCNGTTGWTMSVTGNTFDQLAYTAATTAAGINGIYCDSTGPGTNCIYDISNNIIGGFSITGGTSNDKLYRGIFAASGSSATGVTFRVYHNSINMPTQTGAIAGGATEGQSICAIGTNTAGFALDVKNNIISLAQQGSLANPSSAIFKSSTTGALTSNGNDLYVTGTNSTFGILNGSSASGTKYTSFSGSGATSWKDVTGANQDANGISVDPSVAQSGYTGAWISATNLHFSASPGPLYASSVAAGTTTDIEGQARSLTAPTRGADEVDLVSPTPVLSTGAGALVNGAISVSVNTGEATTNFVSADITPTNATVSSFSGSGSSYSFTLTPTANGAFSATVNAGAYTDAAGNPNLAGNSVGSTYDGTAPTPALSTLAPASVNGAITVNVDTGEATTDFASGDVTPTNATVSAFTGSGSSYSFTLTPTAAGAFSATVGAGTYTDAATNANLAGNSAGSNYDNTAPTPVLSTLAPSNVNGAITVSVNTGEATTDFASGDVTPTNATVSGFSGSGSSYSFTLTPTAAGAFSATVGAATYTDAATNANLAGNSAGSSFDSTAPASAASVTDSTQAGHTSILVDFVASDAGSGVASTNLYAKGPSDGAFLDTGLVQTGTSGTFGFIAAQGNGKYEFATRSADVAGNAQLAPVAAQATVLLNTTANGAFSQTVATGNDVLVFPMTDGLDTTITLTGATPSGTISVARSTPRGATPAYFVTPSGQLLDEKLTITGAGLGIFTGTMEWGYATAGAPTIDTVYQFDAGASPSNTYIVSPSNGVITVFGITSFSTWFAGNAAAVPVRVSAFSIE